MWYTWSASIVRLCSDCQRELACCVHSRIILRTWEVFPWMRLCARLDWEGLTRVLRHFRDRAGDSAQAFDLWAGLPCSISWLLHRGHWSLWVLFRRLLTHPWVGLLSVGLLENSSLGKAACLESSGLGCAHGAHGALQGPCMSALGKNEETTMISLHNCFIFLFLLKIHLAAPGLGGSM